MNFSLPLDLHSLIDTLCSSVRNRMQNVLDSFIVQIKRQFAMGRGLPALTRAGWVVLHTFVPLLISLDYLESFAVRSKERGMKMVQFEMNLSVPAVPALAELLNCGPRSRLYNSGSRFTASLRRVQNLDIEQKKNIYRNVMTYNYFELIIIAVVIKLDKSARKNIFTFIFWYIYTVLFIIEVVFNIFCL